MTLTNPFVIFIIQAFYNSSRNTCYDYIFWEAMGNNCIGTNNHIVANGHSWHNCYTFPYPNIISNRDRLTGQWTLFGGAVKSEVVILPWKWSNIVTRLATKT